MLIVNWKGKRNYMTLDMESVLTRPRPRPRQRRSVGSATELSTTNTATTGPGAPCAASTKQIAKAQRAVDGHAPVKRNRYIQLTGATKSMTRNTGAKARALPGRKGYCHPHRGDAGPVLPTRNPRGQAENLHPLGLAGYEATCPNSGLNDKQSIT